MGSVTLHPNIAVKLYGGEQSYLTHQKVAEMASIDVKRVKVEHLAFFNKTWKGMQKSPLYKYYSQHEPLMLENISKDKKANGYKITSRRMFKTEVAIMTDVIKNLNQKGIEVLYVYDALLCKEQDKPVVIEAMNRIIREHGIKTSVKADVVAVSEVHKYRLEDEVNLYEVLPELSFTVQESMAIIDGLNSSKVSMKELVTYVGYQRKQQLYKDYDGVAITVERINQLKRMIIS